MSNVRRDEFEAFCKGFICNASIETLAICFNSTLINMIGPFLEQSCSLRCLTVNDRWGVDERIVSNSLRFLSSSLTRFDTLEAIEFGDCEFSSTNVELLILALRGHLRLSSIDLSNNTVTGGGLAALASLVSKPNSSLIHLNLRHCSLDDVGAGILASALGRNSTIQHLNLAQNRSITVTGWRSFSAVLQNPNSVLETVNLGFNSIDDDTLVCFANSLINNSKLKELFLDNGQYGQYNTTAITRWDALPNVLCNKSSIDATSNSNHTLQRIFQRWNVAESQLPSDLSTLLLLNRVHTKVEAARLKIIKAHFSGDFCMQPFIDMNLKVLPHVIAWMAKFEYGRSMMYHFVRNTSFIVDIRGGYKSCNEPKSKRQKV